MLAQQLDAISSSLDDEFIGVIMLVNYQQTNKPIVMAMEKSSAKITSDFVKETMIFTLSVQTPHFIMSAGRKRNAQKAKTMQMFPLQNI